MARIRNQPVTSGLQCQGYTNSPLMRRSLTGGAIQRAKVLCIRCNQGYAQVSFDTTQKAVGRDSKRNSAFHIQLYQEMNSCSLFVLLHIIWSVNERYFLSIYTTISLFPVSFPLFIYVYSQVNIPVSNFITFHVASTAFIKEIIVKHRFYPL